MENKIELLKGVEALNDQQQRDFVWRCAASTLPLMVQQDHWDCWSEAEMHVGQIFNALDMMSYGGIYTEKVIKNKVIKENPEATEIEIQKAITATWKEIASGIDYMYSELTYFKNCADTEIPEEIAMVNDQSDDYFESEEYYDLSYELLDALNSLKALVAAVKFFNKKEGNIEAVIDRTLELKVPIASLKDVLNGLKDPTLKKNRSGGHYQAYARYDKLIRELNLREEVKVYMQLLDNNFEMDIPTLERRLFYAV